MPDLGELEIVERSLVIHEAKAGGRRLTKSLFRQLPDWNKVHGSLILPDCSADIVASVSYHWKECDDTGYKYGNQVSGEHIHILLSENNKPYRGTVWAGPRQRNGIDINSWDSMAGEAIAAKLARKKINGEDMPRETDITREMLYGEFRLNYKGRRIAFTCDYEMRTDLQTSIERDAVRSARGDWLSRIGQEARGRLVKVAQLQETEEALEAKVDDYIVAEDSYRADVEQVWRLVTRETPQVFI